MSGNIEKAPGGAEESEFPETPPRQPLAPKPSTVKAKPTPFTSARKLEDQAIFLSPKEIGRPPKKPNFGIPKMGGLGLGAADKVAQSPRNKYKTKPEEKAPVIDAPPAIQWDSDDDK